jgi:murein DD-endopeptidase MepM/ murein hydrolase activator NlpD
MAIYLSKQRWLGIVTALFLFTDIFKYADARNLQTYNPASNARFCHPLKGKGFVSQGFNGSTHRGREAYAYDLATSIGTPVYAMMPGVVLSVRDGYPDTGGDFSKAAKFNYVMIEQADGYRAAYVHLQHGFRSKAGVKAGDRIQQGQLIGYSGNSGYSSGPHLHIELQIPGKDFGFTQTVPFLIAGVCESGSFSKTPEQKPKPVFRTHSMR